MAYRRSLITRAKCLVQRERAFCHPHAHAADDRQTHPPIRENPRIPYLFHTRPGINSFKNPFQDPRFCSPPRNMSTAVDGYRAGVEGVANEVAIAAADSYLPVQALQYLIHYVHIFTGFDWWASIIATTIVIRWITLPLMINQLKATSKLTLLKPKLDAINQEMQNRGMAPAAVAEGQQKMQAVMKEYGVSVFTPLKGILIQGPIFVSFFMAISNMVEKVPSFKQGGVLWFTDLTIPDSMYIFPVLTALTFWITVECNAQDGLEGNPAAKTIKNVSRAFAALSIPFTAGFPKAVFCYWITSNLFSLSYGLVIKKPAVKKLLGIPRIPVSPPSEQKPGLPFFETLKKYAAAQQHIAAQQHGQSLPAEVSKPTSQGISSSSVNERIKSLEKQVRGRKKNKRR